MKFGRTTIFSAAVIALTVPALAAPHTRRGPTSQHLFTKRAPARPVAKPAGQHVIDPERATQIQTALIKQGYMTGEPTGKWDASTQAALEKLQGDNGWQTKMIPDSRALIKLGLGPGSTPSPESAVTSGASHSPEIPNMSAPQAFAEPETPLSTNP
jgi:hypothetical protein